MKRYVIALDQGTTSSRAIVFDREFRILSQAQIKFPQLYPHPGWVEHDPMELFISQYNAMMEAYLKSGVPAAEIAAIGITNQRESTLVWNRRTGQPVFNAIVWQCRRTADRCRRLQEEPGFVQAVRETTGLPIDAYFSATKIQWILENIPGARAMAENGELCFGTVDSWLIWKLTGGARHITDHTNASRTMLYNIHTRQWDEGLCRRLNIPMAMLPQVQPSGSVFGTIQLDGAEIPIAGVAGDQQAALFGQGCYGPGQVKNTYGTGCFLLMNTGSEPVRSQHGLITTLAASRPGQNQYVLEGSVFTGGAVIQWLRDEMHLIEKSSDAEYYASQVPDTGGVYFVPAFTGLGAPRWDMYARGAIVGLTRGTGPAHIIRAAQESIAYQSAELVRAMEQDTGMPLRELRVDGGASRDAFLMQFQADILNLTVRRPVIRETTALGAAGLAGLTVGLWKDESELARLWSCEREFTPRMSQAERNDKLRGWNKAVGRSLNWEEQR